MKRIKTLIGVMWLRNISYQGVGENPSQIKGLDENRMVQGVRVHTGYSGWLIYNDYGSVNYTICCISCNRYGNCNLAEYEIG